MTAVTEMSYAWRAHLVVRAAPLVRVKVKFTVKNAVCEESSAIAYGVFDCEFAYHSHQWICSQVGVWTDLQLKTVSESVGVTWVEKCTVNCMPRSNDEVEQLHS